MDVRAGLRFLRVHLTKITATVTLTPGWSDLPELDRFLQIVYFARPGTPVQLALGFLPGGGSHGRLQAARLGDPVPRCTPSVDDNQEEL